MLHGGPFMNTVRSRVLVVDEREGALLRALGPSLAHHDVEIAHDATDAIYALDLLTAGRVRPDSLRADGVGAHDA